ncbi:MAG TPA: hemerythrin domain-containing protein [Intrasporangium sp.]|uniref:hemerythrin domain-containing protein n=1 Tax=Intrasporangium sp. TaxID=1925024 RepID=UPI002D799422|nr:hemerythrin domain-containing protein [Intrasporangium sp.]HET7399169.1 hemerythrin domain-containing protein [Intrasporangium sp.]
MCGYCGCRDIAPIGRLMAEHEQLTTLAGDLSRARDTGAQSVVDRALDHLVGTLHPHAHDEEHGIFSLLRRNPDFTAHVDRLCSEHSALDALVASVRAGDLGVVDELVDLLRTHMDKEDNGLFPAAAIELDGPDWEEVEAAGTRR